MFPGVLMLDIDQIASIMRYGRGHLYNLSCEGKLPFKVSRGVGNKILVSIVEMADYLDKTMLSEYDPAPPQTELVVKKRGRPRGSSNKTSSFTMGFQDELHQAVFRVRTKELFADLRIAFDAMELSGVDSLSCSRILSQHRMRLTNVAAEAERRFDVLNLTLGRKAVPDVPFLDREIPFFVSDRGLVLDVCVAVSNLDASTLAEFRVQWFTWPHGFALPWIAETNRLAWLHKMTQWSSDLPLAVAEYRRQALNLI